MLAELLPLLHRTFAPALEVFPTPLEYRITRWGLDPYSFGSYSYDKLGWKQQHRIDLRAPEISPPPAATPPRAHSPQLARGTPSSEASPASGARSSSADGASEKTLERPPRLFFAGEACSTDAPQCVHGAVDTGEEAAKELLRAMTLVMACLCGSGSWWLSTLPTRPNWDRHTHLRPLHLVLPLDILA